MKQKNMIDEKKKQLESSLVKNVGKENADFFINQLKEAFMEQKNMTNEEKIKILKVNVTRELCFLESSLMKNIGKENAAFFVDPLREKVQSMINELKGEN